MGIGTGGYFGNSPREIFVNRAKMKGEKTTFINGKEFAILGNGVEKIYSEITGQVESVEYTEDNIEDIEKLLDLSADMPSPTKLIREKLEEMQEQLGFNSTDTYGSLGYLNEIGINYNNQIEKLQAKLEILENLVKENIKKENQPKKKKYI
jgi:hypothetical protein